MAQTQAVINQNYSNQNEQHQYLTFCLSKEMFAIPILSSKEIIEFGDMTTVPMMPSFVRGVINLRGSVVPVIDLSARFGRESTGVGRRTCIVIVEADHQGERLELGVVVDAVSEVIDIHPSNIEPAPSFGARIRADFISGMGKIEERFVIILNIDKVLAVDEMAQLAQLDGATSDDAELHPA